MTSPGEPADPRNPDALSLLLRELVAVPPEEDRWTEVLPAGEVIGRFEILRELGRGGFGVVYEARDRELGRSVAFKAVNPGTAAGGREQLLREAETIARLQHPNLVTLFDAGRCDRGPYLVLELLRGQTLKDRLGTGALPIDEALGVAADVARGLAHAHAAGVVHRDLKPSNVFVTEDGTAKLLDFGLSHAFGRKGASGGTPAFMAPEQWKEQPEDARTDLFALGALIYRMVSGRLPFGTDGRPLAEGRSAPPLEVPGVPALGALVGRLLALDPSDRPRSAEEVLARLEAIRGARRDAGRRRRTFVRWGAAVALAAVLGAAAGGLARRPARRDPSHPRSVAVLPFASLSEAADDRFFAEGVHGELITQLARLSGLLVIARGSVQQYGPGQRNLEAIAGELGVDAVLEGAVQRAGSRTRVTARLSDPRTGAQLWADRFDRDTQDLFSVQAEVALEIAGALGASLTPGERAAVARSPTTDREAHDLYLRGLYYWERSSGVESDNRAALELFEKAAARAPGFALAHAGVAVVRTEWAQDCEGGRAALARAAALDPEATEVHTARGRVLELCDNDLRGAIAEYDAALRDKPGDAGVRAYRGSARTTAGDYDGGLEDLRRAWALAPRSYLAAIDLTQELIAVRRFDEAARSCARAREVEPGDVHALLLCALIPYWRDGDPLEVRRAVEGLPRELPSSGTGAWSLFRALSLLPDVTLRLAAEGRLREPFSSQPFLPRAYVLGSAQRELGQEAAARASFADALSQFEARAAKEGKPGRQLRLFIARARAGAGQVEEGLAEARAVLEASKEPERRAIALGFVAEIAAAGGKPDVAVGALRELLGIRGGLATPASIRAAPRFAALRGDPGFEALVAGATVAASAAATPPGPRP